jgi:FdhD protein
MIAEETMERSRPQAVTVWDGQNRKAGHQRLIGEEPLAIRVEGRPYAVVLRTPGDELAHAAGFCLAEGLVDRPDDFAALALCDGEGSNVVTATLTARRRKIAGRLLERRGYISQTGCGLCGREILEELQHQILPLSDRHPPLDPQLALRSLDELPTHQPLRTEVRSAHGSALYAADGSLLAAAEDVGRHNALDKAIGRLFLDGRLEAAAFAVLSSRISYELVQKAARARIPVIIAVSRPTALAVSLATSLRIALACPTELGPLTLFCMPQRFTG